MYRTRLGAKIERAIYFRRTWLVHPYACLLAKGRGVHTIRLGICSLGVPSPTNVQAVAVVLCNAHDSRNNRMSSSMFLFPHGLGALGAHGTCRPLQSGAFYSELRSSTDVGLSFPEPSTTTKDGLRRRRGEQDVGREDIRIS